MHAAAQHEPTRIAVVLDVTAERGDGEYRVEGRRPRRLRSLGDGAQQVALILRQRTRQRAGAFRLRQVTEKEQPPGDLRRDGESVEDAMRASAAVSQTGSRS